MSADSKIFIAIVEDNKFIRNGWEILFNAEPFFEVIGSFSNCSDAFNSGTLGKADIIILDIKLPGISGIEGAKYLSKHYPRSLILISTAYEDDKNVFDAISSGAIGFIPKKSSPSEFIKSIRLTLNGGSPMTPNVARQIISRQKLSSLGKEDVTKLFTPIQKSVIEKISAGKTYNTVAAELNKSVREIMIEIRKIYSLIHKNLNKKTESQNEEQT